MVWSKHAFIGEGFAWCPGVPQRSFCSLSKPHLGLISFWSGSCCEEPGRVFVAPNYQTANSCCSLDGRGVAI